jgi:threonine dehydrogenase-like Zn-dependent dehydrogenase
MWAAVTTAQGVMEVADRPDPGEPRAGELVVRPEVVGICGSDFHYFLGDIGTIEDPSVLYPRVQGHEFSALIDAVGPDCPSTLRPGHRVAVWPLLACGTCYPCRIGRVNVCANISLLGIHRDGALQERLRVPASQAFPVGDLGAPLAALVEPFSIAVQTTKRGRIDAGEQVVVLGAGPIGQAVTLAAIEKGASVLLVDRLETRLAHARTSGADLLQLTADDDLADVARAWAGGDGPQVVVEATGVPGLVPRAVAAVAPAGRVVVVGLSSHDVPLRVGDLPLKEIDLLGVSCCREAEFAEAVALVGRHEEVAAELVTNEFPLEQAPEAIAFAMQHPAEVMKAVVRVDGR